MKLEDDNLERLRDQKLAAKRKAARERKRKSRANLKSKIAQEEKERCDRYCRYNNVVGVLELEPGVLADTYEEWLLCARRFASAAGLPDVQEGESLNDLERRVYGAVSKRDEKTGEWVMPFLSLKTGKFDDRWETRHDEHINSRGFPPFLDSPIDISTLEPLSTVAVRNGLAGWSAGPVEPIDAAANNPTQTALKAVKGSA